MLAEFRHYRRHFHWRAGMSKEATINSHRCSKIWIFLFSFALSVHGLITHAAQSADWTGRVSTAWNDPLNWSPNLVPTTGIVRVETSNPNVAIAENVSASLTRLYVGDARNTQGSLLLTDGANFTTGAVQIGSQGIGSLQIVNSNVQAASTSVGDFGAGTLSLSGAQAQYINTNYVIVGGYETGYGVLTVENRAHLYANGLGLGNGRGAGDAVFDNATVELGRFLNQMGRREDTHLAIRNGATVSVGDYLWHGGFDNSVGYLDIDGSGTAVSVSNNAFLGWDGRGEAVISNHALLSAKNVIVGNFVFGHGNVVVTSGGELRAQEDLILGYSGKGYLTVNDNASVEAARIILGAGTPLTDPEGIVYTPYGELAIGGMRTGTPRPAGTIVASSVQFGPGEGTIVFNHTSSKYMFDATINGGADNAVGSGTGLVGSGRIEALAGRTILNADHGDFNGALEIRDQGILQLNGNISGAVASVLEGGRLEGAGIIGSTNNVGTIAPGTSIGTLTIDGDYSGLGGILEIETILGGDSSQSDRLVITGNSSGQTYVNVLNGGGEGAPTAEGIKIIDVGGISGGAFSLVSDYTTEDGKPAIIAGAYAYTLHHNGIRDPADGSWYLRSTINKPPTEPEEPGEPSEPVEPPSLPRYGASIPVYEAYPQVLQVLNGLPTLRQRAGNRYWNNAGNSVIAQGADAISPRSPLEEAGPMVENNGVWGRIEGSHNHFDPRFSTTGSKYEMDTFKLQAGVDGMLHEGERGKLIGGIIAHYAHGKADIRSIYDAIDGGGRISTDGYGIGSTLTWYADSGFYLDAQAQATWYESDLSYSGGNNALADGNNGFGYALSMEGGKRFSLNPYWFVTPQAQLTFSNVDFDSFTDPYGADVWLDRNNSLQGRVGVAVEHQNSWYNSSGMIDRTNVYGLANLYYEFLEGTRVDVSDTSFASRNDRIWGGIGLGGSYNWNDDKFAAYGDGAINTSLNNFGESFTYKGTVGFKIKF